MPQDPPPPAVGNAAPLFGLRSVQGPTVELAAYRGRRNVVLWFSRGFAVERAEGAGSVFTVERPECPPADAG